MRTDCGCQGYEPSLENICDTCHHKVGFHARLTENAQGNQQTASVFPPFPILQSSAAATVGASTSANSRSRETQIASSTNTTIASSVRNNDIVSIAAAVNRDISPYPTNNFTQRLHERRFNPYPRGRSRGRTVRDNQLNHSQRVCSPSPAGPRPLRYPYQCTVIVLKELHQWTKI